MTAVLKTAKGCVRFPAFLPVTTFGDKFPLDNLVRPYLDRFAKAVMTSHFYAKQIKPQSLPVFIDSGGFASLFKESRIIHLPNGSHAIQTRENNVISPQSVLDFQEKHAEIGSTLDFIISPETSEKDGENLQDLTVANAKWALLNKKTDKLKIYASLQAWDKDSMNRIMESLAPLPFDGFALGGMVPRIRTPRLIFELTSAFREIEATRPLHIFGIGSPRLVKALYDYGISSVDSSNYVRQAVSKRYLLPSSGEYVQIDERLEPSSVCRCNICQQFSRDYLSLKGELNNMALALHNISATFFYLEIGENNGR